jgi:GH15 family glucan-1,4-alpha-glucosidase
VYAALLAAADLADIANDPDNAVRWRSAADDIAAAAHKHLWNEKRGAFYKGVHIHPDGSMDYDETIDLSSIFGAFMFGLFPVGSDQLKRAIATMRRVFSFNPGVNGLARYENDGYRRLDGMPSNWWCITTLWMAQYALENGDIDEAHTIVQWVNAHASQSDILPEQINPTTGEFISVAPLTWSHSEYVATLLDMIHEEPS